MGGENKIVNFHSSTWCMGRQTKARGLDPAQSKPGPRNQRVYLKCISGLFVGPAWCFYMSRTCAFI